MLPPTPDEVWAVLTVFWGKTWPAPFWVISHLAMSSAVLTTPYEPLTNHFGWERLMTWPYARM